MAAETSLSRKRQKLEDLHCVQSEMKLRKDLIQSFREERTKRELTEVAQLDDPELIERLFKAGFTAENLPAISVAPIAMVAWGSGFVTIEERGTAMEAIFNTDISGNLSAISQFRRWLEARPTAELLTLWADYTRAQSRRLRPGTVEAHRDRMIRLANQVALASGGFLGFGIISSGEQTVIDRIGEVYAEVLI